ncbi:hypothetical protein [Paraburkholderia bannensis]|uniref:hypothetical protein n=1 Tax=Paraburkholderia bannensis TaxID=765414 RepID=UPI002AC33728|nr:hypothetical protein [Paraburkholderia bannensis]
MIKINFRQDLIEHVDAQLEELGYVPDEAGEARESAPSYLMLLVRALRRMPSVQPRRVLMARGFSVPEQHKAGFESLERSIKSGMELRPWLSTSVASLTKRDALLDDWGIHHFHLGAAPRKPGDVFVARTDEVAFSVVRADAVYFLLAARHNRRAAPLVWTQPELIEIIHQNWPDLIGTTKLSPRGRVLTAADHAQFREHPVNAGVTTTDGTVYYPPGGGMMSNKDAATDYVYQMQLLRTLEDLSVRVQEHESQMRTTFRVSGDQDFELRAHFRISFPEGFQIGLRRADTDLLIWV